MVFSLGIRKGQNFSRWRGEQKSTPVPGCGHSLNCGQDSVGAPGRHEQLGRGCLEVHLYL